jgi:protein-S-isoprenylcysteine O-methyltransferase Ste14
MTLKYLLISIIFIFFGFVVFRIIVRRDYLRRAILSPFSYSLELIIFAIHANLMYLFIPAKWPNLPTFPDNLTLIITALIIFCFGFIILLGAWFGLGSGTSFGQGKNKLQTNGLYHFSRNPQLIGYGIMLISIPLLYLSWYSIGWLLQYLIISYFMIKSEEEFLQLRYGEEYKYYCGKVPRIIKLYHN